jgi:2-polyprenyl-3-methyl-5-hydroxy-6-metoxy-1,4-benzoquinol methylase
MPAGGEASRTGPGQYWYNPKGQGVILELVPPGSTVLDLGCTDGFLGVELARKGCRLWGVDIDSDAVAAVPAGVYEDARAFDLNTLAADAQLPWPDQRFDVILAADVLEHLVDPVTVLRTLITHLSARGQVVVTLPNVAHLTVRLGLLVGRFDPQVHGILDETHLHLYTHRSADQLMQACGLRVVSVRGTSNRFAGLLRGRGPLTRVIRGNLAHSIVLVAVPTNRRIS